MNEELTEEQKNKIIESIEQIHKQHSGNSTESLAQIISEDTTKLIDCRHEIVINVIASIYEQDDEGKTVGIKEVAKNNYHIPVPPTKDYNEYIKGFFGFLEECMSNSSIKADETTPDSGEKNNG
jgi:phenylpyruvate tautomerase PptA (4-oxalocrotonate tautomerase family)